MIRLDNIMHTQTYATLRYLFINSLFAGCMYLGFYKEINGFENAALVVGWITTLLGLIVYFAFSVNEREMNEQISEAIRKGTKNMKFGMPHWFDILFDVLVGLTFIWYDHQVLGVLYLCHIAAGFKVRHAVYNHTFDLLKYGPNTKDEEDA